MTKLPENINHCAYPRMRLVLPQERCLVPERQSLAPDRLEMQNYL